MEEEPPTIVDHVPSEYQVEGEPYENDPQNKLYEKKPASSRFKQQTLWAWIPSYKIGDLYWKFLLVGFIYIPIGVLIQLSSHSLVEIEVPYTDCKSVNDPSKTCADIIEASPGDSCMCRERFNITKDIDSEVFIYYKLTNFYQNHRMYVKSKDDQQALGKIGTAESPKSPHDDCEPYIKDGQGRFFLPCGAIANSLFNDTMQLFRIQDGQQIPVDLKRTGIAWESDRNHKFKNPELFNDTSNEIWKKFTQPPDWGSKTLWDLDPADPNNNGLQNEDLIIWMRTAALPNFRKLHRIVKGNKLQAGEYVFEINYSYRTKIFKGTKSYVLQSTSKWIGSKNSTLGITTCVVGGVAIVFALVFLYIHIIGHRRKNAVAPSEDAPASDDDDLKSEYVLSVLEML